MMKIPRPGIATLTITEHTIMYAIVGFVCTFTGAFGPVVLSLVGLPFHFLATTPWVVAVLFVGGVTGLTISTFAFARLYPARCPACDGPAYVVGTRGFILIYKCRTCDHLELAKLQLRG